MAIKSKFIKSGADPIYVNVTGDTMTGPLILYGAPSLDLEAATKAYVDAQKESAMDYADSVAGGRPGGAVIWYASAGAPSTSVGQENDLYLDKETLEIYKKSSTGWSVFAHMLTEEEKAKLEDLQGIIERTAFFFAVAL